MIVCRRKVVQIRCSRALTDCIRFNTIGAANSFMSIFLPHLILFSPSLTENSIASQTGRKEPVLFYLLLLHLILLRRLLELAVVQVGVESIPCHQSFVITAFDDVAVFHHQNAVGVFDGGQPVGDDEAGAALSQEIHGSLYL